MGSRSYDPAEIRQAGGESISAPDPEYSFFLGPTSESNQVYAFAHKLDALLFIRGFYGDHLGEAESQAVESQIDQICKELSDGNTAPLAELIGDSESLEIYADGYWDDFVLASQPFWEDWIEEADEPLLQPTLLDEDDDEEENPDKIVDEAEDRVGSFLFLEPPEDVFNVEFVDALMRIIPVA
ncbi:MAG: hypothetical protein PVG78_00090 [Desulfobacterales bacterium]|jgi:hypothetical protein